MKPMSAIARSPANVAHITGCSAPRVRSRRSASAHAATKTTPPPRGTGTSWELRSLGWSSIAARASMRRKASVPTSVATNAPPMSAGSGIVAVDAIDATEAIEAIEAIVHSVAFMRHAPRRGRWPRRARSPHQVQRVRAARKWADSIRRSPRVWHP